MALKIRLTLLGLWVGVMAFFSFVVAPSAFSVLPTQQLAANVVNRTLGVTEIAGIVIGLVLLAIFLFTRERPSKDQSIELIILILMTVATLVSRFIVSSRLHAMRAEFGDISALAASDPVRASFNQMHQFSVWLMAFNILAAIVLIVILLRRNT